MYIVFQSMLAIGTSVVEIMISQVYTIFHSSFHFFIIHQPWEWSALSQDVLLTIISAR